MGLRRTVHDLSSSRHDRESDDLSGNIAKAYTRSMRARTDRPCDGLYIDIPEILLCQAMRE